MVDIDREMAGIVSTDVQKETRDAIRKAESDPFPGVPKPVAGSSAGLYPRDEDKARVARPISTPNKVSAGAYAGLQRSDAVNMEVEKLRDSVKAQRRNMLKTSQDRLEELHNALESATAHYNISDNECDALNQEACNDIQLEIDRANKLLETLNGRMLEQKAKHRTDKTKLAETYRDQMEDLQALIDAEESVVIRLMKKTSDSDASYNRTASMLENKGVPMPSGLRDALNPQDKDKPGDYALAT